MNDEKNIPETDLKISAEMEARVVAWVCGEASASEAAELAGLTAANPGLAAFRRRIEAVLSLTAEAAATDSEPLRLSGERRTELLRRIDADEPPVRAQPDFSGVPTLSQIPIIMRRFNLAFAAVFSIVLIAGVTWWGERTHFRAPPRVLGDPVFKGALFTVKPDDPVPVEVEDPLPKKKVEDLAPPAQADVPAKPTLKDFIQPIEPPRPNVDFKIDRIPASGGGGGGPGLYTLSELDEAPVPKYQARPVYPGSLRQEGISGEAVVDFIVDLNGEVRNAVAVHSSHREFEESACTAVGKWKFRAGRKGGRPVYVHMQVPIVFSLSADSGP